MSCKNQATKYKKYQRYMQMNKRKAFIPTRRTSLYGGCSSWGQKEF
jgi:hypothetical protein